MPRYEPWNPIDQLPEFFDCFARDEEHGLELLLQTADNDGRVLVIRFVGHVPAYRQIVEECRLTKFRREDEGSNQLWKVKESSWLAEFGEADLVHYPNLTHFLIETGNQCFDVLSDKEPEVEWKQ